MKFLRNSILPVLAVAALAAPAEAPRAQVVGGFYLQGGAGVNQVRDHDIDLGVTETEVEYETGWLGSAAVGYGWASGLRLELEFDYRSNGVDRGAGAATGDARAMNLMANAIYALPTRGVLAPFVGLGVGGARVTLDSIQPIGAGGAATTVVDDSDTSLAFQGIVGVEYAVTERLGLNLSYRYMAAPWLDYTAQNGAAAETNYQSHALMVGLRFSFGAPPAPMRAAEPPPRPVAQAPAPSPAPAPAPAPRQEAPRPFLVFFDWDSSALTNEARNVVRSAAESARNNRVTRIELTGHADRSGPQGYNMRLSQRRAEAVKAELVRNGIAANEIVTLAKGETQPLVPTADGVREPQNRRVEVVFPGR